MLQQLLAALKSPRASPALANFIHVPPFEKGAGETTEPPKPYTFEELREVVLALLWEIGQAA
jgi:hypothetical protein